MNGHPAISPIYTLGPETSPRDPLEEWGRIERLRRAAWRDAGVVAVRPDELPEPLRGMVQSWAEQNYGQRIGNGER